MHCAPRRCRPAPLQTCTGGAGLQQCVCNRVQVCNIHRGGKLLEVGAPLLVAEWDDRGEHDYTSSGCSPTHLAVPLIPRHAGGGDGGASGCALVPSTPRGAPPGGAEADEEVTPPAAPHKAAAPLAGRRAVRRLLFGDQCAEGGEVMVASGGPAAPVPLATLRTVTPPSAAALRLQAAVRGWLVRRAGAGDVGVEPLWLQEAAVLLAADGGCAGPCSG